MTDWASRLPETVSARTAPVSPTSVVSPLTPRTSVRPLDAGDDGAGADHADLDGEPAGTARETTALRCQPLRSSHLRKPFQGRSS